MRVLIVDDDPDDRAMARRGVELALPGSSVVEAWTPEGLDAALAGAAPDVAVIDYSLGWSDGLTLFRRIRAAHPHAGVVMFTGSLGEEGAVEAMRAGLDDYVVKGAARIPRLVEAVRSAAGRAAERRARRRAEARHAALARSATVGVVGCRRDGTIVSANPAARRMLGLGEGREEGVLPDLLRAPGLRALWDDPDGPSIGGLEVGFGRGGAALLDAHSVGEGGEVECVLTEVTALRAAVVRSDVLLREVYHRVYNNLQIVDALISLEAVKHSDPAVKDSFRQVRQRLKAIALVQQRLHRGDDFGAVEMRGYLEEVAAALSLSRPRPEIAVRVDAPAELRIPLDLAVPLGLLATELVTNAFKHAFPGGRGGTVRIALETDGTGGLSIRVADDGIGRRPWEPGSAAPGVGSRIVEELARQIGGDVEWRSDPGAGTAVVVAVPPDAVSDGR